MKKWQFSVLLSMISLIIMQNCIGLLAQFYWALLATIGGIFAAIYLVKGE